ncbi:hypothetical protein [Polycladidibacter hongkongensis]|uniref:hypothetical protein n=1 Tax=Polycladidibacter hongkongensis TaxID=1647556 RepID=UPI0012E370CA|nr:hypothetical protein [Pseudovibrio hongkongensis]
MFFELRRVVGLGLLWPFQAVSFLLSVAYLAFLGVNALLIIVVPALWDLYVVEEPRLMGALRRTSFYEETAFWGAPFLFLILVFFNLLLANALLNTHIYRGAWRLFRPVHYAPLSLRSYGIAIFGLCYYAACYGADWFLYEFQVQAFMQQVASVRQTLVALVS